MPGRRCTCCDGIKDFNEFSSQKTNPAKLYQWCDDCRKLHSRPKRNQSYSDEIKVMRDKAKQLRKFDDTQAAELHRLYTTDKVPIKELAVRFQASPTTIAKTIRRVK